MSVDNIISFIECMHEDFESIPKNIVSRLDNIKTILSQDGDVSIQKNKCISELDDVHEDYNLSADMRCQLWDIVSCLEQL